jgi:hypothetical protein
MPDEGRPSPECAPPALAAEGAACVGASVRAQRGDSGPGQARQTTPRCPRSDPSELPPARESDRMQRSQAEGARRAGQSERGIRATHATGARGPWSSSTGSTRRGPRSNSRRACSRTRTSSRWRASSRCARDAWPTRGRSSRPHAIATRTPATRGTTWDAWPKHRGGGSTRHRTSSVRPTAPSGRKHVSPMNYDERPTSRIAWPPGHACAPRLPQPPTVRASATCARPRRSCARTGTPKPSRPRPAADHPRWGERARGILAAAK